MNLLKRQHLFTLLFFFFFLLFVFGGDGGARGEGAMVFVGKARVIRGRSRRRLDVQDQQGEYGGL